MAIAMFLKEMRSCVEALLGEAELFKQISRQRQGKEMKCW
jgi:hypothetical protein